MKTIIFIFSFIITIQHLFAQNDEYSVLILKADSLYNANQFKSASFIYEKAFKINGGKGQTKDIYNAARAQALVQNADNAFFHLDRIATDELFSDYPYITTDPAFNSLHSDARWSLLIYLIKEHQGKAKIHLKILLNADLDSIDDRTQANRKQLQIVSNKYGWESNEIKALWKIVDERDSISLSILKAIVEKDIWIGDKNIGDRIISNLFLILNLSELDIQETYLPLMREVVQKSNAEADVLAVIEDKVAMQQGKRQNYGSAIITDNETKLPYVFPLEDPDNVDRRRAAIGVGSLLEYLLEWGIKWDVEQYKIDLPKYELIEKKKREENIPAK